MTDSDHRASYSVLKLYVNGLRMVDDYDEEAAVEDFIRLHPEAVETQVRAELMRELAKPG